MYVGKPRTKTCLYQVLDIAQGCLSQDSRTDKLQKEDVSFYEARLIERKTRPIESHILQNFNQAQSPRKRLGFELNITLYKRKILTTLNLLGSLVSYSYEICEVSVAF